jgi:hypothetical protein
MAIYTIEIIARYEIETKNIDDVRLNYDTPTLEYCKSIVGEPLFLSGGFLFEEEQRVCKCEICQSPDKHNIFAEGFCKECFEECQEGKN